MLSSINCRRQYTLWRRRPIPGNRRTLGERIHCNFRHPHMKWQASEHLVQCQTLAEPPYALRPSFCCTWDAFHSIIVPSTLSPSARLQSSFLPCSLTSQAYVQLLNTTHPTDHSACLPTGTPSDTKAHPCFLRGCLEPGAVRRAVLAPPTPEGLPGQQVPRSGTPRPGGAGVRRARSPRADVHPAGGCGPLRRVEAVCWGTNTADPTHPRALP